MLRLKQFASNLDEGPAENKKDEKEPILIHHQSNKKIDSLNDDEYFNSSKLSFKEQTKGLGSLNKTTIVKQNNLNKEIKDEKNISKNENQAAPVKEVKEAITKVAPQIQIPIKEEEIEHSPIKQKKQEVNQPNLS